MSETLSVRRTTDPVPRPLVITKRPGPPLEISVGPAPTEPCPLCGAPTPPPSVLLHLHTAHSIPILDSPTQCPFCGDSGPSAATVLRHAADRHAPELFARLRERGPPALDAYIRAHAPAPPPAPVRPALDPARIAKKGASLTELPPEVRAHLDSLHHFELFLRMYDLVDLERAQCRVCDFAGDSSVALIEHCQHRHRVTVTPELRRVLSVLSAEVTPETPDTALLTMGRLRLDLLLRPPSVVWPPGEILLRKSVPALLADFLIECLATERHEAHSTPKNFDRPQRTWLRLPVPMPVLFSASDSRAKHELAFADTDTITAKEIWAQVNGVLNQLHKERVVVVRVADASRRADPFSPAALTALAAREGLEVLRAEGPPGEATLALTLFLRGPVGDGARGAIRAELERAQAWRCRHCGKIFDAASADGCEGRKVGSLRIQKRAAVHEQGQALSTIEFLDMTISQAIGLK